MHLKRSNVSPSWTIPRKGTKYVAVASHDKNKSVPLIVVMRDTLKLVKTKKELEKALKENHVQINHKHITDVNYPIGLFDILTLPSEKKQYKLTFNTKGKLVFNEVSDKESEHKVFKVMSRTMMKGSKMQVNLSNGKNIITKDKMKTGDSVVVDLKTGKILKIIGLEKGKTAFVIKGKHIGKHGKIGEIIERGGKHLAKMTSDDSRINVWTKNLIVIE